MYIIISSRDGKNQRTKESPAKKKKKNCRRKKKKKRRRKSDDLSEWKGSWIIPMYTHISALWLPSRGRRLHT